ncbi:hypothetical protein XENOCAPTIV_020642, partial [Xenoophorus captivus]
VEGMTDWLQDKNQLQANVYLILLESPFLGEFEKGDNKGVVVSHVVYPLQALQAHASTVPSLL